MRIPVYYDPTGESDEYRFHQAPGWLEVDPETHDGTGFLVVQYENKDQVRAAITLASAMDDYECMAWAFDLSAFLISREYWEDFGWIDSQGNIIPADGQ